MSKKITIPSIFISILLAGLVAIGIDQGSVNISGISLIYFCCAFIFLAQWLVFIPSYIFETEHYFDLTGSLTYVSVTLLAILFTVDISLRDILLALFVWIWAFRLGSFLFVRVKKAGSDGRFDLMKKDFWWFLMTWTIQGLWVFLTLAMALAAITSESKMAIDIFAVVGTLIWIFGFSIEVVADQQKTNFKDDPDNKDKFITVGLWSWSRHPNYFGEMVLWIGIAVIAFPILIGWQLVALISPIFVIFLLTRISGITMLESRGYKKWKDDPAYIDYLERTSVLVPFPPKKN
jgi:steroid 5-alpha reductase family enzyme